MTNRDLWTWVVGLFLVLIGVGCGRTTAIRPIPLPLDQNIAEYIVLQTLQACGETTILVSSLKKDAHRYLVIASEPDPQTLQARWAIIAVTEDPTQSYLWQGTAESPDGPVHVTTGHPFAVPEHLDLCQLVVGKTTL